uniref:Uncharacterized protein n=3 Tax=Hemiselmis andersenii TaxID=464988 RepID=A0A7S0TEC7_HEMAN
MTAGERMRLRAAYNRMAYSPSMGVTEEEQKVLMERHMAALQAAASSPGCSDKWASPTTPEQSLGAACDGEDISAEEGKPLNSFMSRKWYNQQAYSPSMGASEEEIMAKRQEASSGFEPQNASIEEEEEESWGVSLAEDQQQQEPQQQEGVAASAD